MREIDSYNVLTINNQTSTKNCQEEEEVKVFILVLELESHLDICPLASYCSFPLVW
jgi:hypothetical protein